MAARPGVGLEWGGRRAVRDRRAAPRTMPAALGHPDRLPGRPRRGSAASAPCAGPPGGPPPWQPGGREPFVRCAGGETALAVDAIDRRRPRRPRRPCAQRRSWRARGPAGTHPGPPPCRHDAARGRRQPRPISTWCCAATTSRLHDLVSSPARAWAWAATWASSQRVATSRRRSAQPSPLDVLGAPGGIAMARTVGRSNTTDHRAIVRVGAGTPRPVPRWPGHAASRRW